MAVKRTRVKAASGGEQEAIRRGRRAAAEVLRFRQGERRKRALAVASPPAAPAKPPSRAVSATARARAPARAAAPAPASSFAALGPARSNGVLIAEGDSWFDYPLHDVLRLLEDHHGYDVESVAHAGDRVEDMAYSAGQFEEFARRLEKILRQGRIPKAILLSGGGNDIAGDELGILLNHAQSALPAINEDIVRGVIDVRLRDAYLYMIGGLTAITAEHLGRPLPIVLHGYDHPIPDGRGFMGGLGLLPGPWLEPGFRRKGHAVLATNTQHVRALIDRFNTMLQGVASQPGLGHVHHVDLRSTFPTSGYRKYWGNELHPTGRGFELVTAKLAARIAQL